MKPTDGDRRRGFYLLVLLAVYFSAGQMTEYLAGARWIEIGAVGRTQHARPWIEFVGLAYNALVEGAVFYMPYFTIPLGLRLVESIETESNVKTAKLKGA
jgi:hypothetical protein